MSTTFREGDMVVVSGPPGEVIGSVLHAATPDQMPAIEGAPPIDEVREILREFGVDFMLWIGYRTNDGKEVFFTALHTSQSPTGWRDLKGQDLRLARPGQEL